MREGFHPLRDLGADDPGRVRRRGRAAHLDDTAIIDRDTDAARIRAIEGADAGALFKRHSKTPRPLANELRFYQRNRPRRQFHPISSAPTSSEPPSWREVIRGFRRKAPQWESRGTVRWPGAACELS